MDRIGKSANLSSREQLTTHRRHPEARRGPVMVMMRSSGTGCQDQIDLSKSDKDFAASSPLLSFDKDDKHTFKLEPSPSKANLVTLDSGQALAKPTMM